jgi:hypothetical protein
MNETITLDGDPITLAHALGNYIIQEQRGEREYTERGETELAGICTRSIKRAAELLEQVNPCLGYCHSRCRTGCSDPLPHTICEM